MSSSNKPPHYLIIGAGVAGCSLAYELTKHQAGVTLLDAGQIAKQGASAVPVALLNPHRGRTARASELDKAGLNAVWDLLTELESLGLDHGIHKSDILRIASSEKQARLWQKLEGVQWLNTEQIPAGYHAPFGGILVKGGWLKPRLFLKTLVDAACQRGLRVIENQEVAGIDCLAGGGFEVSFLNPADPLRPDVIVLCLGAGRIQGLGLPELEHFSGDLVTFEAEVELYYPLAGAIYGLQEQGKVFIGGNHREQLTDPSAVQHLQKSASWFIPALKQARVVSTWSGTRARQEDNQPLLLELSPNLIFFGALGGRGFLCSSYLSKLLVQSLLKI